MVGNALGWPSPVLPRMEGEESYPFRIKEEEVSWMVSLLYVGNLLSPFPAGLLADLLGRRGALLLLTVLPLSAWLIIIYSTAPWMLYVSRFLAGLWSGAAVTITPMYLAEISEPRIRGALSTLMQITTNMGVLYEYVLGPMVSYETLGFLSEALPILFLCFFSLVPESPHWFLMKGKRERAEASLAWLRAASEGEVKVELEALEAAVQEEMKRKAGIPDLRNNLKAIMIVEGLAVFQRASGISALMAFTSITLPPAGAGSLSVSQCVVLMGLVWLVTVFISTLLVDTLGRKPLLLISSAGCGAAMFLAGLWFFLDEKSNTDVSNFYWAPFASFLLYGMFFNVGLGPVASTVQGEFFPANIKALASGLTSFVLGFTSFVMNKVYHPIYLTWGMYLNYWIFSGTCAASFGFVLLFMIETKGKTLQEVQDTLNHPQKESKHPRKNP